MGNRLRYEVSEKDFIAIAHPAISGEVGRIIPLGDGAGWCFVNTEKRTVFAAATVEEVVTWAEENLVFDFKLVVTTKIVGKKHPTESYLEFVQFRWEVPA